MEWRGTPNSDVSADFATLIHPYLEYGARHGDREYLAKVLQGWNRQVDKYNDIRLALFEAIYRGDDVAVQMLFDAGVSPETNEPCDPHFTPLLVASQFGRLEMARRFWERLGPEGRFFSPGGRSSLGRRPSVSNGPTCLQVAARNGRAALVTFFLDVWDGWTTKEKIGALVGASGERWDDCVAVLLKRLDYEPQALQEALESAIRMRKILAEDPTDYLRRQRLGDARGDEVEADARRRQRRIICDLIDAGATLEGHGRPNGPGTLRFAVSQRDYTASLSALVEKGADTSVRDSDGGTALHALLRKGSPAHKLSWCQDSIEDRTAALQLLLDHGASPDVADDAGETPLHLAAGNGTLEQLQLCLARSRLADALTAPNAQGETPLHYAAASGHDEIVAYLLAQGNADVADAVSRSGWTPLLCAVSPARGKSGQTAFGVAARLLARGAGADTVTTEGWSPLHAVAAWRSEPPEFPSMDEVCGYDPGAREHLVRLAHELVRRGAPLDPEPAFLRDPAVTPDRLLGAWGFRMQALAAESLGQDGNESSGGAVPDTTPLAWAIRTGAMDLVQVFLDRLSAMAQVRPTYLAHDSSAA